MITMIMSALLLVLMRIGNNMTQLDKLNSIYRELLAIDTELYQMYKDSDEATSVHITILQTDLQTCITVLEDLLGIE